MTDQISEKSVEQADAGEASMPSMATPELLATDEVVATPGDQLRALQGEARQRGSRYVSAQAMQARLFSVYDAAAAAEGALTLVQRQLTLTLDRGFYEAAEIDTLASELDQLLAEADGPVDAGASSSED